MNKDKNNIIVLNGAKSEELVEPAKLQCGEKLYEMKAFAISGESVDGRRLAFTWNASLDDMIIFNYVLNKAVDREASKVLYPKKENNNKQ